MLESRLRPSLASRRMKDQYDSQLWMDRSEMDSLKIRSEALLCIDAGVW